MGISPDMPIPSNDKDGYPLSCKDTIPNIKIPNPYEPDTIVYKNEETFEREKINEEVMHEIQQAPLKKPNKLKILFNKLFGKKPQQAKYNYTDCIPPYDK